MTDAAPLRVLVVDDSAFARQTISSILKEIPGVEVVGKATDGADAIPKVMKLQPDLITLDLEMPHMDGFELLRWLMATRPTPTIVVSSVTATADVFRAMELGALDVIRKPRRATSPELESIKDEIARVVADLPQLQLSQKDGRTRLRPRVERPAPPAAPPPPPPAPRGESKPLRVGGVPPDLVVLGASTGGPAAVERILRALPEDFPSAIIIVQHMPPGFTHLFAERLDRLARLPVLETKTGQRLQPGQAYVCAGGAHTIMDHEGTLAVVRPTGGDRYVPSVDRTMGSAATAYGDRMLAVLLTGMGDDGKIGMMAVDRARGLTVAESEETALVYGMPERAISAGAVDLVLPLDAIADLMVGMAARRRA